MSKRKMPWWRYNSGFDYGNLKVWVIVSLLWIGVALLLALLVAGVMWIDNSACYQRQEDRPDIRVVWHWNTGCIILNPDQTVVVSS